MNGTVWTYPGSRWWKFDFHTHTPASDDYSKGSNQAIQRQISPEDWLLAFMRAEIDCVAVTDHNSGAWIDKLKDAYAHMKEQADAGSPPDGFRELTIFPGVEISANGNIHVLAIFDPSKTSADVHQLLGAVRYRGTRGASHVAADASPKDVVEEIAKAGGIPILAHVDEPSGAFRMLSGNTLAPLLDAEHLFAIEVCDLTKPKPQPYLQRKLTWAEVLGSDSHHLSGTSGQRFPGSHFTYVKMGTPTLEGLRLALLDGLLSVRRSDEVADDPNGHADLVIEAIEISQARYMGRSQTFKVELNPWLNAIIGGRGTGKSTLLEFFRIALRREGELPASFAADFEKYRKIYSSRDDDGLLTQESKLSVIYRKHRTRFRIRWSASGDVGPIEVEDEGGVWKPDPGDVVQRFPVRIYSQKQIFELAKSPLALLRIVDEANEVDRRTWNESWKAEEARFLSLRARAREIETGLADEPRLQGEYEDVKRKLAIFEESRHADVLKEYQKRSDQRKIIEDWEKTWFDFGRRLREVARDLLPNSLDASLFQANIDEDRDIQERANQALHKLKRVQEQLEELATEVDNIATQWRDARDASAWKRAVDDASVAYDKLCDRLKNEGAGAPSAYGELVQRRQVLEGRLKELQTRRAELDNVQCEADSSLDRIKDLRRNLTARRTVFLSKVLQENPYVRIEVVPYGAREMAEPELRRLLQREDGRFEKDIGTYIDLIYRNPADSTVVEERLSEVKKTFREIASGTYEGELADKRFASHLSKLPPEAFDRIDLWFPEDSLKVQYSTTADGTGFRSIQEGSPGQKTAALLAFLFSYGEEPILLDQPEDDLDNHLIYDLIVGQLRRTKQRRQVIVVTHNANIVVNGDAELVVALAARGGETHKDCFGCLQEQAVRKTICTVMEGGPEAFKRRWKRLGGA